MAVVLAIVIGALIVGSYFLRGQALRMIPILAELGVWAAIRTGPRWTPHDLLERLASGARRLAAAASLPTRLA